MDVIALTRAFVDIESTTFNEDRMGDSLAQVLGELTDRFLGTLTHQEVAPGRTNYLATWGDPLVVLSTHFDCVPPHIPSSEDDRNVYGRGSCDAKGILASMIAASEQLLMAGVRDFGILAVVGEERDSEGAYAAANWPAGAADRVQFLVNGEPTEGKLALGSKGALRIELIAEGKAAHSAYPELGDSAIDKLLDAIERVRRLPLPSNSVLGESTMNIGVIHGGVAPNVIAASASAEILVRLVDDGILLSKQIFDAVGDSVNCREVLRIPGLVMSAIDGLETCTVRFTTDAGILAGRWGEPLLYGPGSISVAHTDHEFISKSDLHEAVGVYQRIVTQLLGRAAVKA